MLSLARKWHWHREISLILAGTRSRKEFHCIGRHGRKQARILTLVDTLVHGTNQNTKLARCGPTDLRVQMYHK